MAHAVGVTRSQLLLRGMNEVLSGNLDHFDDLVARRAAHEPVAYILGSAEFYGRTFAVSPDVLIPRPDSEALIEAAFERAPQANRMLDLGTGSGCLLLTAMLELEASHGVGIDASLGALEIARRNAMRLGLAPDRAGFSLNDWNARGWSEQLGTFDLILCNPPYVEQDAELDPDVCDYEPASALFAGPEGLDDYRAIVPQIRGLLNPGALPFWKSATRRPMLSQTLHKRRVSLRKFAMILQKGHELWFFGNESAARAWQMHRGSLAVESDLSRGPLRRSTRSSSELPLYLTGWVIPSVSRWADTRE